MPSKGSAGAAEGRGQQQQQQQPSEKATSNATKSNAAANAAAAAIAERTKVVIRKCPPELPETIFWNSVQPHLDEATIDWKLVRLWPMSGRSG
jgi:regulator of nonsense transcripts 3